MRAIADGIVSHRRGKGLAAFRNQILTTLGGQSAATYTSYRRAVAACLRELAATGDESEILIPAFCSSDYPEAIEGVGLTPRRYDIAPDSLSARVESLTENAGEETLAVVVINVLGYGSQMDEIAAYCRDHGIYLIEALGYGYGSSYEGELLGTFGDCSLLNFQQGKPVPIGGGMVVSNNEALAFSDTGRSAVSPAVTTLAGYAALGHPRAYYGYGRTKQLLGQLSVAPDRPTTHPESKFGVAYEPPFQTLSNFHGAVGTRVLDNLDRHRQHRAATAAVYSEELADCPQVSQLHPIAGLSNHQHVRYPLVVAETDLRENIRTALTAVGVDTAVLYDWPPLSATTYPGASQLQDSILTLPTHPYVDTTDRQLIVETVKEVC